MFGLSLDLFLRPGGKPSVKIRSYLVLALALTAVPAHAQQVDDRARAAARSLAEDGVAALQSGDTATAVDKLERAYQIVKLPAVGLWSARALAKSGRLVNASERYAEIAHWSGTTGDMRAQDQAKADAVRERDALLPRIPDVTISLQGASPNDVAITLDGEPVLAALIGTPQPTDPKHHVVHGTRGAESVDEAFDAAEGQHAAVTLKFGAAPAAAAPPAAAPTPAPAAPAAAAPEPAPAASSGFWNTQRILGASLAGAGIVSGIVSAVFTSSAISKKSDADHFCNDSGACTSQVGVDSLSSARSAGNVATITGIVGASLAGAGIVVFLTAPHAHKEIAVTPGYLTGGGAVVATGTF
jgi:hypothetical protein